jgi:hypothetical protein
MPLNESIVEDAALSWFGELGYAVGHGPQLAPGEPATEHAGGTLILAFSEREKEKREAAWRLRLSIWPHSFVALRGTLLARLLNGGLSMTDRTVKIWRTL